MIPEEDGSLLYVFDAEGYRLRTEDAVSGQVLLTFSYTDYPQGRRRLAAAADAD